jgi:hypothetical protein
VMSPVRKRVFRALSRTLSFSILSPPPHQLTPYSSLLKIFVRADKSINHDELSSAVYDIFATSEPGGMIYLLGANGTNASQSPPMTVYREKEREKCKCVVA